MRDGDIIGERIWGRPLSVVKRWGAAICTGFYFVRSNPRTITIFDWRLACLHKVLMLMSLQEAVKDAYFPETRY
mgnify:CR=1 FL=1